MISRSVRKEIKMTENWLELVLGFCFIGNSLIF
jgi:hypothetical protein